MFLLFVSFNITIQRSQSFRLNVGAMYLIYLTYKQQPGISWLLPSASQFLLLVLYNVQAYIKMLFMVTC